MPRPRHVSYIPSLVYCLPSFKPILTLVECSNDNGEDGAPSVFQESEIPRQSSVAGAYTMFLIAREHSGNCFLNRETCRLYVRRYERCFHLLSVNVTCVVVCTNLNSPPNGTNTKSSHISVQLDTANDPLAEPPRGPSSKPPATPQVRTFRVSAPEARSITISPTTPSSTAKKRKKPPPAKANASPNKKTKVCACN